MDLTAVSTISSAFGILAPGGFVLLFIWVIWRTESRHTLVHRLWQLIHGNQEISDPEIRAFISEQNSLMSFRFIAGVPVSTLEHARQLIQWTKLRNVEMFTLRMAGRYFDPDQRHVRVEDLPSKLMQLIKLTSVVLFIPMIFVFTSIAFLDSAILKVKITDRWLLMSENEARPLWPLTADSIHKATCSIDTSADAGRSKLTEKEVSVLCGVLKHDNTPKYIRDAQKGQQRSSIFLVFVTFLAALICLVEFTSGFAAKRLVRRKLDPGLDNHVIPHA